MRYLISSLILFMACTHIHAQQSIKLNIPGIGKVEATSIQYLTAAPTNSGGRNGASSIAGPYVQVTRNTDSKSATISSAATKGRYFKTAYLAYALADGSYQEDELNKVVITNYTSTTNTSGSTESFRLFYHTKTTVNK